VGAAKSGFRPARRAARSGTQGRARFPLYRIMF